jgi:hypothetical protein
MVLGQVILLASEAVFCGHASDPAIGQMLVEVAIATDEIKHLQHVQMNFECFFFYMLVSS